MHGVKDRLTSDVLANADELTGMCTYEDGNVLLLDVEALHADPWDPQGLSIMPLFPTIINIDNDNAPALMVKVPVCDRSRF